MKERPPCLYSQRSAVVGFRRESNPVMLAEIQVRQDAHAFTFNHPAAVILRPIRLTSYRNLGISRASWAIPG